jgi:F-type H+-transporting ATPase subunit alpha
VLDTIAAGKWDDSVVESLDNALVDFKQGFNPSDGGPNVIDIPADALGEGEEGAETVTRHVPPKK